jgi:hypothetical protein
MATYMSKKIKVIHVIPSYKGGGAEFLVRELCAMLPKRGIETEAIYFGIGASHIKTVELLPNEQILGIPLRSPMAIFKLRKLFKKYLAEDKALIIHAHLTWSFFYVVLASIGLQIKLVYTEHATFNNRRSFTFMRFIDCFFYEKFERIICISEGTKNSLCNWLGSELCIKTQVILNGARQYPFKERNFAYDMRSINFISVGSLVPYKGFDVSVVALSKLSNLDWQYFIVGDGVERGHLQALIDKLQLKDRVKLVGFVDNVVDYLHNADIQLVPSRYEGFGLVAVEGMSTGLPVVGSNVSGLLEVLDQSLSSVFLVDDFENPLAWSESILSCVDALKRRSSEISLASRQNAERFTIDKMVDAYVDVYRNLLF